MYEQRTNTHLAITLVALIAAVAAAGLAIIALNKKPAAAQKLNLGSVAALTSEAEALKAEVTVLHGLVAKSDATVAKLTTCIPELTGQISGLSVETSTVTAAETQLLTNAYLKTGKQISTYCQSTLEPPGPGGTR
jgi:hypothetical protein